MMANAFANRYNPNGVMPGTGTMTAPPVSPNLQAPRGISPFIPAPQMPISGPIQAPVNSPIQDPVGTPRAMPQSVVPAQNNWQQPQNYNLYAGMMRRPGFNF